MDKYNAFIEEVNSLEIRIAELMTEPKVIDQITYITLLPVWHLDTNAFTEHEKQGLIDKGHQFIECWDLSHYYDEREQIIWETSYNNKLKKMRTIALNDVTSKKHAKMLLRALEQQIIQFKGFGKLWKEEEMSKECYNQYWSHFQTYYQDDLKLYYLSFFTTAGLQKKYAGYSTHFLKMLDDLYKIKLAAFESLKTHLTAMLGKKLKRGENEFAFDESKGWVDVTEKKSEIVHDMNITDKQLSLDPNVKLTNAIYKKYYSSAEEIRKRFRIRYSLTEKDLISFPTSKVGDLIECDPPVPNNPKEAFDLFSGYHAACICEIEKLNFEIKYTVWNKDSIEAEIDILGSWITETEKLKYSDAVRDEHRGSIKNKESDRYEYLRLKKGFYTGYTMTADQCNWVSISSQVYGKYFLFYDFLKQQLLDKMKVELGNSNEGSYGSGKDLPILVGINILEITDKLRTLNNKFQKKIFLQSIIKQTNIERGLKLWEEDCSLVVTQYKINPAWQGVVAALHGEFDLTTANNKDAYEFGHKHYHDYLSLIALLDETKANANGFFESEKISEKLSISTYSLKHVYLAMFNGQAVTQQNKKELALKYGYNSGDQLRNDFTKYQDESKRLDLNSSNKKSANTHLKRFRDILPLLEKENSAAFERVKRDLLTLESIYNKYY